MKFALNYKKIMIVALLTLLAVISITKIAPAAADPANHKHSQAEPPPHRRRFPFCRAICAHL